MKNRRVLCALPFVAILALVPAVSLLSDNNLSIEEARKAVTDLVQLVGPEHDCDISNVALRKVSPADEEYAIYFVSYDALGLRCELANQELNERGKPKGLWFNRRPKAEIIDKAPEEPNLDLIHEVNPPVDVGNWNRADGGNKNSGALGVAIWGTCGRYAAEGRITNQRLAPLVPR